MINLHIHPALLFTPGNKPNLFQKAAEVEASAIIIDLEDSVPCSDKQLARDNAIHYCTMSQSDNTANIIRINHLTSNEGLKDILAITTTKLQIDAVLYPKTESPNDIQQLDKLLAQTYTDIAIIALIETANGTMNIDNIAKDSPQKLQALMFGAADYASDLNCDNSINVLSSARSKIVEASAANNLACFDSPYFDFNNEDGLNKELNIVKGMGFNGKAAIHPKQISAIKSSFKPTQEQYEKAEKIVEIYNNSKGKACQYQGEMIDVPVYSKAKQVISIFNKLS
ncbi:HpcH/HpaI aldolase/citrate lyase family protein [Microbulbifer sp. DLAB2-AF]|uniref:HpcH/HpaI aldolase/citrate lyase family protein n=1 Tax=Microbulbifer sp. DLAB2-AF TaxID=3243395 RepID=UPI00403A208A